MSKWIVALLVGLLSFKCLLGAEASFMDDFNDDMGLETGSFESEQISLESEDISRRDLDGDENSVIGSFAIPDESVAPVAESKLPEQPISQPILSVPLEQRAAVQPSSPSVPVQSAPLASSEQQQVPLPSSEQPQIPLPTAEKPAAVPSDQPLSLPIIAPSQPLKPTQVPNSARANPSSSVIFTMDVSNVIDGSTSLQQAVEDAVDNEEEEGSTPESSEGEEASDDGEGSYEEITYSRPKATYSEDSQSDSSDAEWYALIHSRRPSSYNQPPPVTNIPSSRDRSYNRHRDDRYEGRRDRRREGHNRDDRRPREEERGGNRERFARYDPNEAQGGPYFVPGNSLRQRDHRKDHADRYSEYSSSSSSGSSSSSETRHHHKSGRRHKKHKRRPGHFERLALEIPRKVTDL